MRQFLLRKLWIILSLLLSCATVSAAEPETQLLRLYTEHSPPGEYLDARGEVAGATVELIRLLLQRLDQPATIELLPWARAFELAQSQQNTALFETVRNKEREARFKWVGPLKVYTIGLYGRSDVFQGNQINPGASSRYLACEYRDSVHVNALKRLGFTEGRNLILTVNHGDCLNLLRHGRVHLTAMNDTSAAGYALQMQQSGHELVMVQALTEARLYLAFSRDIDDSTIARWQQVLEHSYLDGSMRGLYQGIYTEQMISRLEAFAKTSAASQQ
ncbi:hypothetical protein WG68_10930 [Arsukibacterium ikkense]|uniref:Solute-binding protein family 3/N-terminal domain-containing protein n=1 Tax=Arsukibacterium ikkense TaxID=336831 RepID=A0A0M2V7V5_9GAMM|nr:transporter substrate-binding domain-containing protein [Arsukibacterium ikkense]KKO45238.1 hypothetical protein WG68_10930 [Arsukibacterium ikkense]